MKQRYQSQVDTKWQSTLYEMFPKGGTYNHAVLSASRTELFGGCDGKLKGKGTRIGVTCSDSEAAQVVSQLPPA
jgi:hypothetical protein